MKALKWIAWISAGIGVLFILFAAISIFTGLNVLGFIYRPNYLQVADSFFLLTIALFIFLYRCECKK
jgi:hypothetical protein